MGGGSKVLPNFTGGYLGARALLMPTVPANAIKATTTGCQVATLESLSTPLDTSAARAATTTPERAETVALLIRNLLNKSVHITGRQSR